MFPIITMNSFCALARFCTNKNYARTLKFLDETWDRTAINKMMFITLTKSKEDLTMWLIGANIEEKVNFIKDSIKQFK
jgi:hypothetical protein